MSLILDALRKSEAERRRAQAPDLFSEPALALPRRQPAWPHWKWATLAVAALLGSLLLLRAVWPTEHRTALAAVPDSEPLRAASNAGIRSASRAAEPDPLPVPMPVRTPIQQPVATLAPTPQSRTAPASATTAPAVAPQEPAPAPATAVASTPIAQPLTPPQTSATPVPVPVAGSEPASGTLRLADLGTAERQQLPPLKLSMHLWNDAPAQRFVILDGQRLGEGDRIGDAVVEQITRDGAILAWNGRRLTVSMR